MSNERDELAREIFIADNSNSPDPTHEWEMTTRHNAAYSAYAYEIADGLIAVGYRKPRTITTADELDALPIGSVIASFIERPGTGLVCQMKLDGLWYFTADEGGVTASYINQWREVTVLWEPQS